MEDEKEHNRTSPDQVTVVIEGMRKKWGVGAEENDDAHTETVHLSPSENLRTLWSSLTDLGYDQPYQLENGSNRWHQFDTKQCVHPFEEIEVVDGKPSDPEKSININDTFIAFANRQLKREVNLNIKEVSNGNEYCGPMEKLVDDRGLDISFHRTIRMPDDEKLHQLPGSLGTFPLYNVSAYSGSLSMNIVEQGGVFLPMWQREALWINLSAPYKQEYALRVFVGRINAVSGKEMDKASEENQDGEEVQDYVVVPGQEWLDGICVAPGIVRQFVAMPLGSGYTVEGQKTGEEKYGGLQIEIIPSYEKGLRVWLPESAKPVNGHFNYRRDALVEGKSPKEVGLGPGDKIRSHPPEPTYSRPLLISDLIENLQAEVIHLKAHYRGLAYGTWRERSHEGLVGLGDARSGTRFSAYASDEMFVPESYQGIPSRPRAGMSSSNSQGPLVISANSLARVPQGASEQDSKTFDLGGRPYPSSTEATETPEDRSFKGIAKDLKAMGLAAGGKLIQDIYKDHCDAGIWNTEAAKTVHIHILDPASCEKVTHIVPPPPPIDAMGYVEANLPFFVVEEQIDNRVDGGDFGNVDSVAAMDKKVGVTNEPAFDPSKPRMCKECETRLCDCIIRPCDHQFCNVCIRKLDTGEESSQNRSRQWKCPTCSSNVAHVAGFSAPMNLPGEEALKVKVPVHVLKVEDGRVQFKSVQKTRI